MVPEDAGDAVVAERIDGVVVECRGIAVVDTFDTWLTRHQDTSFHSPVAFEVNGFATMEEEFVGFLLDKLLGAAIGAQLDDEDVASCLEQASG